MSGVEHIRQTILHTACEGTSVSTAILDFDVQRASSPTQRSKMGDATAGTASA